MQCLVEVGEMVEVVEAVDSMEVFKVVVWWRYLRLWRSVR